MECITRLGRYNNDVSQHWNSNCTVGLELRMRNLIMSRPIMYGSIQVMWHSMYLIESMMPSSLNVCMTLILFSRTSTGDSSYFNTLLIQVHGTLLPVTIYCLSNSITSHLQGVVLDICHKVMSPCFAYVFPQH